MTYPKDFNDYWKNCDKRGFVYSDKHELQELKKMCFKFWKRGREYQRGRPRKVWSDEERML